RVASPVARWEPILEQYRFHGGPRPALGRAGGGPVGAGGTFRATAHRSAAPAAPERAGLGGATDFGRPPPVATPRPHREGIGPAFEPGDSPPVPSRFGVRHAQRSTALARRKLGGLHPRDSLLNFEVFRWLPDPGDVAAWAWRSLPCFVQSRPWRRMRRSLRAQSRF